MKKNIQSSDYHDYVFKNGELVGDFENMYKFSKNIPWHQDQMENLLDIRITVEITKRFMPFNYILDFGCGLGYYLKLLENMLSQPKFPKLKLIGYDVSKTCCEKGSQLFPDIKYFLFDLTNPNAINPNINLEGRNLIVIRGTLWYVFPKLGSVIDNLYKQVSGNDILAVVQNFPPLKSNFVGKDVIPNPDSLVKHFSEKFCVLYTNFFKDEINKSNENWFIGIFKKKIE